MLSSYQLIRSKRKSLGISIKPDGSVIVRVPLRTALATINRFVARYQDWINSKLLLINAVKATQIAELLLYYLGQRYPLKECGDGAFAVDVPAGVAVSKIEFDGNCFLIKAGYMNQVDIIIQQWYYAQAQRLIAPIIQEYSQRFGLYASKIKITSAKTRWGSCNRLGTVCFSYRITMLPITVIHYIVAHELAHLKHLNHSKLFWQQVAHMYPEYKSAQSWLKEHRYMLAANII